MPIASQLDIQCIHGKGLPVERLVVNHSQRHQVNNIPFVFTYIIHTRLNGKWDSENAKRLPMNKEITFLQATG